MFRFGLISFGVLIVLAGCDVSTGGRSQETIAPIPKVSRTGWPQSEADFRAVVRRVEPVAERICRERRRGANCDFSIIIDPRDDLPPNAYQTLDKSGRPVIGFTKALFGVMKNRDELALALSHEAAHHIEGHIPQTQSSATAGVILGTLIGSIAGLDASGVETAQNIGGTIGARRYSKGFELEADALGARIALRAGYDPLRGVLYFADAPDPGDQFLGSHPPNGDRIRVVQQSVASAR